MTSSTAAYKVYDTTTVAAEASYPGVDFGSPERVDGKFFVPMYNIDDSSLHDDLLFATPSTTLSTPVVVGSEPAELLVGHEDSVRALMEHYKGVILDGARASQATWFSKQFEDSMLPDLWRDNVKRKTSEIKLRVNSADKETEPFRVFDPSGQQLEEATELPAGTVVRLLLRLEGVWISRSNFGASYVAVQMMRVGQQPQESAEGAEATAAAGTRVRRGKAVVNEAMLV